MAAFRFVAGVDLGGTKILSVCVDDRVRILDQDLRPTDAEDGRDAVIDRMAESVRKVANGRPLAACGISTPGPSNPALGIVTTPPNLPGWRDVPLARLMSERLGVPCWIENDANAAALAEHRLGAGRGTKHMLLVTLGTGVGGGLILDGKLYYGASGGGGEIGHMQLDANARVCGCGRPGCLEALASGVAMEADAESIIEREPGGTLAALAEREDEVSARVLMMAADAGDSAADASIRRAGRYLGAGLTNLVDVFNPEMIVIGGSLRKLGERYLGEAVAVVRREAFRQHNADVRIVEAELGDESPAIGAALLALERAAG